MSKGSRLNKVSDWDLVEAHDLRQVTVEEPEKEQLPEALQGMSDKELKCSIGEKKKERESIKVQINQLSRQRDAYIRAKEQDVAGEPGLASVVLNNLRKQAKDKNFDVE